MVAGKRVTSKRPSCSTTSPSNDVQRPASAPGSNRTGAPAHLTELTCTKGMLKISYDAGIQIGRDEHWQLIPESVAPAMSRNWMATALIDEWRAFIEAIQTGREIA